MRYELKCHFTTTPNVVLDELMIELSGTEFKVLMLILRKTIGWQKEIDDISISQIMKGTGIKSNKSAISACKILEEKGYIFSIKEPRKTTKYGVNITYLETIDSVINTQANDETYVNNTQATPETGVITTHTKETNINKTNINKKSGALTNVFIKPTIEEIENHAHSIGYNIDAINFYNFYESKGWYVGKNKMKSWKACIATWKQRDKGKTVKLTRDQEMMKTFTEAEG